MRLILASNSPRRKKILTDLGIDFEVVPSNYDEKLADDIFSYEKIEDLATQKCLDVVRRVDKNSLVLAADTVVVFHNKILGKPHSKEEAFEMLNRCKAILIRLLLQLAELTRKQIVLRQLQQPVMSDLPPGRMR